MNARLARVLTEHCRDSAARGSRWEYLDGSIARAVIGSRCFDLTRRGSDSRALFGVLCRNSIGVSWPCRSDVRVNAVSATSLGPGPFTSAHARIYARTHRSV